MSELVERSIHGAVHELKLARAPVNALNPALCEALASALSDAIGSGAQGIVLSADRRSFPRASMFPISWGSAAIATG